MGNINYERNYEASPIFNFNNSATILTTAEWFVDFESDDRTIQKYMPMNSLQITNNSDYDIYIYPNQNRQRAKVIPAGTIITFDRKTLPAIRSLIIYNAGTGTIAINEVEITTWREGVTIDNAFAKMHKSFYKFLSQERSNI